MAPAPWQTCLEESWDSWRVGSAGVGAAIVDGHGELVTTGRNRIADPVKLPGLLSSTWLAHAELNALAALPLGDYGDLTLYTSFEPCLMCASAILFFRIPRVCYAAADPVFDRLDDWFRDLPFAAQRLPERERLGGPFGVFAHVLHLSWLAFWMPEGPIIAAHRSLAPRHLKLAQDLARSGNLANIANGGIVDALAALWEDLCGLSAGDEG